MRFTRIAAIGVLGLACANAWCTLAPAAPLGTTLTATAAQGDLLGRDDAYSSAGNPLSATLSDGFGELEFLTSDLSLGFDFLSDGTLRVYDLAGTGAALSNRFDFDLAALEGQLSAFVLGDLGGLAGGSVRAEIVDADTLRLTLDNVSFSAAFGDFSARFSVPEPSGTALLAVCALCLFVRRRRPRRAGSAT